MTEQTEDEGLIEVMNRKPAFGEATESAQLSLIEELASYVGARKKTSPKRVRSTRSIRESSDPAYDPDISTFSMTSKRLFWMTRLKAKLDSSEH